MKKVLFFIIENWIICGSIMSAILWVYAAIMYAPGEIKIICSKHQPEEVIKLPLVSTWLNKLHQFGHNFISAPEEMKFHNKVIATKKDMMNV